MPEHVARPYSLIYYKKGDYWYIDAKDANEQLVASITHIDGGGRPYMVIHSGVEALYPTYSEACSVFMNILRQGR